MMVITRFKYVKIDFFFFLRRGTSKVQEWMGLGSGE